MNSFLFYSERRRLLSFQFLGNCETLRRLKKNYSTYDKCFRDDGNPRSKCELFNHEWTEIIESFDWTPNLAERHEKFSHSHFFLYSTTYNYSTQCGISTTESTTTIQLTQLQLQLESRFQGRKIFIDGWNMCVQISFHSIVGRFLALSLFSTLGRSGMLSRTIMVEVSSNHFVRIQCWWLA